MASQLTGRGRGHEFGGGWGGRTGSRTSQVGNVERGISVGGVERRAWAALFSLVTSSTVCPEHQITAAEGLISADILHRRSSIALQCAP